MNKKKSNRKEKRVAPAPVFDEVAIKTILDRLERLEIGLDMLRETTRAPPPAPRWRSRGGKLTVIYVLDQEFVCWVPMDWERGDENRVEWDWDRG